MNWLSGLLGSILVRRKSKSNESNIIEYPASWRIVPILGILVFVIILLLPIFLPEFINQDSVFFFVFFFVSIIIAFTYFTVYLFIWKVEVFDSYFVFSRAFRKQQKIAYDNIEMRDVSSGYRFYIDNKHILSISFYQDNYRFLDKAIRSYQKLNKIKIKKEITNILKPIQGLWFLPFGSLIIVFIPTIGIYLDEGLSKGFYISLPFHLITIFLFLFMANWKIVFKDGIITKTTIFGDKKTYEVQYVTYVVSQRFMNPDDTTLYFKGKKIAFIMGNVNNRCELLEYIDNFNKFERSLEVDD
jgi:hypothetical protein